MSFKRNKEDTAFEYEPPRSGFNPILLVPIIIIGIFVTVIFF